MSKLNPTPLAPLVIQLPNNSVVNIHSSNGRSSVITRSSGFISDPEKVAKDFAIASRRVIAKTNRLK